MDKVFEKIKSLQDKYNELEKISDEEITKFVNPIFKPLLNLKPDSFSNIKKIIE
jgi:hypothetical protein